MFSAPSAYAADVNIASTDTTHASGVNGTTETNSLTGNNVTIGENGAGNLPQINGDVVGGGTGSGESAVSGNTLTIHSIRVGSPASVIGGFGGSGTVSGNNAILNGGTIGNIYGGLAQQGGNVSGNILTINAGSLANVIAGFTGGGNGTASGNTVVFNAGTASGQVVGGYVRQGNTTSNATGNHVTIAGGIIGGASGGDVYGGFSSGFGAVTGNTVTITGGTIGGQELLTTNGNVYGGYSSGTGNTTGNIVNLGAADGTYTAGTGMQRVNIYGGNRTSNVTGNELHVRAKGVTVEKIRNFESYHFDLTAPVNAGDTMLSLRTGTLDSNANWNKLYLNAVGWTNDKTKYGRVGTVTLMATTDGNYLRFNNYAAKNGTSGDFEYSVTAATSSFSPTRTQDTTIKASFDRFQNADATADNVTGTAVYGGYSSLGNTTTNNKIKITNTNNTGLSVYGGYTAGAGDSTNNHVTVSLDSRAKQIGGMVVGGTATALNSAIVGNSVTVEGGYVGQGAVGGLAQTSHTGSLKNNTFTLKGDGAVAMAFGALAQGGSGTVGGDSADDGNHAVVEGGRAANGVYGGATMGSGKVSYNTVTISGGEIGSAGAYGGANVATGAGTVIHNSLTVSGGKIEGSVYGGFSQGTGTVTANTVTINGGRFENTSNIYGGYAHGNGTTTGNTVNLGDDTHHDLSGATLSVSDIYGGNKAATGNTLNVNAKNITAKSVGNFENYKFKLNSATTFGDTMLTVANAGNFAGTGVDLNKITVDRTGLSADYLATQHGIKRMTLLKHSNDTDTLTFQNYAARGEAATATETHEFGFVTNNGTDTANALMLEASRFKDSHVTYDGTTPTFGGEVYGGLSRYGHATTGNTLTVTGKPTSGTPLEYAYGGKNEGATGDVKDNTATLELPANTSAIKDIYGGKITNAANAGEVSGNIVNMKQGTVEYAVGGQTDGTGAAKNNTVNLTGGTVTREIYGGLSYKGAATGNTVTISGGTVGSYNPADVYGGKKAPAAGSSASNNTVNLGAEDGTYTADLTKADIHGDNSTDGAVNNNTLNVRGKNITVNSVDNFDKYKFTLNNNIKDGDTMLTLENGGFGREIDFANNFGLDTSKLTGKPTGIITLVKSKTGTLKFKQGYQSRDLGSTDNVEYFVGTDTGEREGSSVIMGYNIFKGNAWTYNGTNPPNAKELFGGVSYNNHTTESNTLTITNTSTTQWVGNTYGGKTAGRTGGSKNNRVVVENTGVGGGLSYVHGGAVTNKKNATGTVTGNSVTLKNGRTSTIYGGYTRGKGAVGGSADDEGNAVTLEDGTAGDVYGGAIDNADSTAAVTGNKVTIQNGTYNRLYGGHTKGKGAAQNNEVTISGGTSSDDVHGGYTHDGGAATGNKVTLTGGVVNGLVYGGYTNNGGDATGNTVTLTGGKVTDKVYAGYADGGAATGNTVNLGNGTGFSAGADFSRTSIYGGNRSDVTGNTLNVKGKNMTVKMAGKFENYTFYLGNDVKDGDTLLTFAQAGGFDGDDADWSKINLDGETLHAWSVGKQRTNTITLLNAAGITFTSAVNQRLLSVHDGMEYGLRTDNVGFATANKIFLDANRFKDGVVDFTATTAGEAVGGISRFGNTTESNRLTVKSLAAGAHSAYGGKTMGAAGGSIKNTVTVTGTGAGTLTNVYGGYVDKAANSGDVTGNTVTLSGGKVTGAVYGGYTNGRGATTNNTVNIGADPTTLRQGDASTLATGTNFTAAELYGGNKSTVGNTLNVMVKDAAAKKAQNFDKYTFYLTNSVAADKPSSGTVDDTYTTSRGTMLTLTDGFDGQTVDWNKVTTDTSKLSADKTLGAITLMRSGSTSKLKFLNYAVKNHAVSGDYEVVQRTDTNTDEANSVLIDVNRFRNGNVTYDGRSADTKTYSGVSYGGHTTENNTLTVTGLRDGINPTLISGGRTEGSAGGAVNNTVKIQSTAYHNPAGSVTEGSIGTVYGGFIGNAANGDATTGNTVEMSGGTVGTIHGGYTKGTGAVTGNTVTFSGGATLHELMGGFADNAGSAAAVTGNTVNLSGGSIGGTVYGGRTLGTGDAVTGNTRNVTNAVTAGQIANFEKLSFAVNKDTVGKTLLTLNGGAQTTGLDWQKLTAQVGTTDLPTKSYEATHVTLMVNEQGIGFTNYDRAKELVADDVYEFSVDRASDGKSVYVDGYRFKDNKTASYAMSDGTHDLAWGGRSEQGHAAEGNMLTITGGTITDTAYGGTSRKGAAKQNRLVMRGGTAQNLVGGFGASASDNTVDIFGGTIGGDVYGGRATNGAASGNTVNLFGAVNIGGTIHGGKASAASTNNTIAVHAFGTTAKDIDNVQNLHFYLPARTTSAETRTMLTLTNAPAVKDISTLNLGVAAVAADARAFRRGDAVSLLKVNGMLTAAELKNTGDAQTMKATQSGILDYTMRLEKRGENELIATVDRVDVNDRSKSPVETRVAASALLNAGADLLSHVGYTAAAEAAAVISERTAPAPSSVEGVRNTNAGLAAAGTAASAGANASAAVSSAFQPWAAQGGSSVRLNSGSYVDAKGWNLNVGFARTNEMKAAKLTYGPFVEYGRGTYDSYLDDGTHGSGAMHYIGGGVMAKMAQDSGLYVEGSLRAGRVKSDYTGSDDAAELSYDNASTYFAGHVGVGQEWKLANGNKIEGYAKYFYSHQAGDTVKLRSGGILEFGDVDSHRLRVGARYTHAVGGGGELYAGLAYEHEFGGDATATYQGYSTPSPSLGGGTGILELGYRFAPKDGRVSYGVNLMGMTGQREGIAGGAQVTWAF